LYQALIPLSAALVAMLISRPYSLLTLLLERASSFPGVYGSGLLIGMSFGAFELSLLGSVLIFYLIGKKVDFGSRCLFYSSLALAGALVGNIIGFLADSLFLAGGSGWQIGLGYVASFGVAEPSSVLDVLAGTVGCFMIPVAGLSLAYLRTGASSLTPSPDVSPTERPVPPSSFYVAVFVVAAAALPVAGIVHALISQGPSSTTIIVFSQNPWPSLISGYVGFLVYPVLLICTFYFLGRNSRFEWKDIPRFMVSIFVAGAVGLLVGIALSEYLVQPGSVLGLFSLFTVPTRALSLAVDWELILFVGFASASLGVARGFTKRQGGAFRRMRTVVPIAMSILVVVVVATAGITAYSLALNPDLTALKYSCSYQPGAQFYLQVVSDQSKSPLTGLHVTGKLVSACPVITSCTGSCPMVPLTIRTLSTSEWITNSTGYISVSPSMLGGSDLWFNLTYLGHEYQAKLGICGGGTTVAQLSLPSGMTSAHEVPRNGLGVGAEVAANGTQIMTGCSPMSFSGNATIS